MTGLLIGWVAAGVYPGRRRAPSLCLPIVLALAAAVAHADDEAPAEKLPAPENALRLDPEQPVWVDKGLTCVYVDGRVVLREGVLEMFACPTGTKEHESVVAVDAKAFLLHAGLLRVGAETGKPVQFAPEYRPPSGEEIEITVAWMDGEEKKTTRAQEWIRHADTKKAMALPFVFAGSGFWTDPDTGRQHYLAESGDLICVSNFSAAMLDVPAPSSQANNELWFEPFTERIPPVGTPVRLVLRPKPAAAGGAEPEVSSPAASISVGGLDSALATLREAKVGEGSTEERQAAWEAVASAPASELPLLLSAMRDVSPLAENWLRTAADAVADRSGAESLPIDALQAFVADHSQSPRARRTAYELILRADERLADRMLDDLLDDPSTEIRYDAVAKVLSAAEEAPDEEKESLYRVALRSARTISQVEDAAFGLEDLGQKVTLVDELGFVTDWSVAGPFDNREGVGFAAAYPPEESLDASAEYEGHDADGPQGPFGWKTFDKHDRLGVIDLNEPLGRRKGAVGYTWATVSSEEPRDVELRYASVCATKVWLNGELVAEHETYHSGSPFDQHVATAELSQGENQLVVKVCQNEQTDSWAEVWPIQLRLTGPGGAPLEGVEFRPGAESEDL